MGGRIVQSVRRTRVLTQAVSAIDGQQPPDYVLCFSVHMARDVQSTCQDLLVDTDGVLVVEGWVPPVSREGAAAKGANVRSWENTRVALDDAMRYLFAKPCPLL